MFRFKSYLRLIWISLFLLMMPGMAHAYLTTIGTATYNGQDYNLIWDDDNNGNSVVWLDYTNVRTTWTNNMAWAASLDNALTINLRDGYNVDWDGSWRLPTIVDGFYEFGYDGTTTAGYNITSSEMGHLYYEELDNLGDYDTSGNLQSESGLIETGDFENIAEVWYWSSTQCNINKYYAWAFNMGIGCITGGSTPYDEYGLAVRTGQVSVSSTPAPGTIVLLGVGIVVLAGLRRKKYFNKA